MADAILTTTDLANVPKSGATVALGSVAPGATSAETSERTHNALLGEVVDDARDLAYVVLAKRQGDPAFTVAGIDLLERRGVQVRTDKLNGVTVSEPFVSLGTGVRLRVPDLAAGEFHEYTSRALPPVGGSEEFVTFKISIASTRFISVADPAAVDPGIRRGIGDGQTTAILSRSGSIGVTGIEDLLVPDYAWVYTGIPRSELLNTKIVSDADGSAATLASGQSYAWRLVLDAATVTIIKGDLVTGTAVFADLPALPAGNRFLGWGVRDFAVDLTFTPVLPLPDYFNVTVAGLDATAAGASPSAGASMIVAGHKLDPTTPVVASLTAFADNTVQMLRDATLAVTLDGTLAEAGAEFLAEITTDGVTETGRVELRRWHGGRTIVWDMGSVANNQEAYWRNSRSRSAFVRSDMVSAQITVALGADTAGLLKFDILVKEDGVAEVSLFTSQGSDDRRPGWDFGDTNEVDFGLPEKLDIPAGAMLICRAAMTLDVSFPKAVVAVEIDEG